MGNANSGTDTTNYSAIIRRETTTIFYEKFWKNLVRNLIKYFGTEEAREIQGALQRNAIRIDSPETYFFTIGNLSDPSFEFYNECNSFDEFYIKTLINLKQQAEGGQTGIVIREFFLVLVDMLSKENCPVPNGNLASFLKLFITALTNITHPSPFIIQIPDPYYALQIQDTLGLNLSKINEFYETFLLCFNEIAQENRTINKNTFPPRIQIISPAYKTSRENQIMYLASLFTEEISQIRKLAFKIPSLAEDTPGLRTLLEQLIQKHELQDIKSEDIIDDLKDIKDTSKTYNLFSMYHHLVERQVFSRYFRKIIIDKRIDRIIPEYETYIKTFQPYYSNVIIDCSQTNEENLVFLMDAAKNLNLMKTYLFSHIRDRYMKNPNFKITFKNVDMVHTNYVEIIKDKLEQIKSSTNKNFFVEILGNTDDTRHEFEKIDTKYIRIISDIHHDYNIDRKYKFNFGDDFVINCGDTAGNATHNIKWNKSNIKHGIVVVGNHLGYTPLTKGENRDTSMESTRDSQIEMLQQELNNKNKVLFLENSMTEYQGIIILGTCLYSNFKLYGDMYAEESMSAASKYLNDFKFIKVKNTGTPVYRQKQWQLKLNQSPKNPIIRTITPQDYAYHFQKAFNFLKEKVTEFKYSPIVVATHFAPSIYSISSKYEGSPISPVFASNLNDFIFSNPNIRVWAHGHIHSSFDYLLGETRIICQPFGYFNENKADLPLNYGKHIAIKDIKSKLPWTDICKEEIKEGLIKVYKE